MQSRAISKLSTESFFCDLTATTGCPKAVQIPVLIRKVVQMNIYKHDPNKFFIELAEKPDYPML